MKNELIRIFISFGVIVFYFLLAAGSGTQKKQPTTWEGPLSTRYVYYKINTNPEGAEVKINGQSYGISPVYLNSSEKIKKRGSLVRTFTCEKDGFQKTEKSLTFSTTYKSKAEAEANTQYFTIELKPFYYAGYKIISDPPGANVTFKDNNQFVGQTPTNVWYSYNSTCEKFWKYFIVEKIDYETVEKGILLYPKYTSQNEAVSDPQTLFVLLRPYSPIEKKETTIVVPPEPQKVVENPIEVEQPVKNTSPRFYQVTDYDQWFNGLIICFKRHDDFTAETLIYGYPGNNEEYTRRIQSVALAGVLTWLISAASNSNEGKEFAENYLLKGTPFMRWYLQRANNVLDQQELNNLMSKIGY